jgi:hypothetical protein
LGTERSCLLRQEKAKWKSKTLGLCPRLFLKKLFSRNEVFHGMQENVLKGFEKNKKKATNHLFKNELMASK